ncbi:MAG TPA: hypothetical protein VKP65_22020 [Rhodothermales bacterium]|nr:hypothetical protein [Rhodothermales bacterium]
MFANSFSQDSKLLAIRTCLLFLVLVFLAACDAAEPVEEEPPPIVPVTERSYTKSITRSFNSPFEESLIAAAEAVYPPRESVVAVVPEWANYEIPQTDYWWWWHFDSVLVPYAITHEAVDYYSGLIDALKAGETHQFIITADLVYEAQVSFEFSYSVEGTEDYLLEKPVVFKRVYVVSMELEWDQYCGILCGMSVRGERVVVFDENGTLINVFFDRQHPVTAI